MWSDSWNWAQALTDLQVKLGAPEQLAWIVSYALGAVIIASLSLLVAMMLIWVPRKIVSRLQEMERPALASERHAATPRW